VNETERERYVRRIQRVFRIPSRLLGLRPVRASKGWRLHVRRQKSEARAKKIGAKK
jgi:hypothetical protein